MTTQNKTKASAISFKYHGQYGGPGYCGGEFGEKCDFSIKPKDDLDKQFKLHDKYYAYGDRGIGDQVLLEGLKSQSGLKAKLAGIGFGLRNAFANTNKTTRDLARVGPSNKEMHIVNGNIKTKTKQKVLTQRKQVTRKAANSSVSTPERYFTPSVSVGVQLKNPHFFKMSSLPIHSDYGSGGIRCEGKQNCLEVLTSASSTALFAAAGATVINSQLMRVSPDYLNGRVAAIATWYTRYAFRKIRFHYYPLVATSQGGGFAIGYSSDSAAEGFQTFTYETVMNMEPSCISPFYVPCIMEIVYKGSQTWFTELDATNSATIRDTCQGALVGFPNITNLGGISQGRIFIEYVLDLYGPTSTYGFTLAKTPDELTYLKEQLRNFRARADVLKVEDHSECKCAKCT